VPPEYSAEREFTVPWKSRVRVLAGSTLAVQCYAAGVGREDNIALVLRTKGGGRRIPFDTVETTRSGNQRMMASHRILEDVAVTISTQEGDAVEQGALWI